jgi:GNAT superfamily N-acetyltransferase
MTEEFSIERVSGHNINDFLFLLTDLARYEQVTPPDAETRERLTRDILLYPPHFEAFIGKLGHLSIGCLTFFLTYSTFKARTTLFIEDLYVLPGYRGKGFGKALFNYCRVTARNRGCGRVDWMVLSWNKPSIGFYEKIGGKKIGWDVYRLEGEEI